MTQCHQPEGVLRSSGSNNVSTKLFVPDGAPCHRSAGETLPPEHPKALAVYFSGTLITSWESELVKTKSEAEADFPIAAPSRTASPRSRWCSRVLMDG